MKVLDITRYNGKMCAIVPTGEPIPVSMIKGTPRKGQAIEEVNGEFVAINAKLDVDCPGGSCPTR